MRSCTTDATYTQRIELPPTTTYVLDNSMQDAGTAIMRYFRIVLAELGARESV